MGRKVVLCATGKPCLANCGEGGKGRGFNHDPCGEDFCTFEDTVPSEPDSSGHTLVAVDTVEGLRYVPSKEPTNAFPTTVMVGGNPPPPVPAGIDATLGERGKRYGEFKDQAVYAQGFAGIAATSPNWAGMAPDQREGLSVIFNKIGRILNGDPDYSDSWHDIAGYATLVDKRLKAEGK